jgi:peroxiredoxin
MSAPTLLETESVLALESLAPDFLIANPDGSGPTRLSDFRGSPVVLSFHPPSWDPSRAEQIALFNRLLSRFLGPGETLVSVSLEGIWCHLQFDDEDARFPVVCAPDGDIAATYGVGGASAVFVLDGDGVVRWRQVSGPEHPATADEVLHALAQLAPILDSRQRRGRITRRDFLAATLAATVMLSARPRVARAAGPPPPPGAAAAGSLPV